MDLHQIVYSSRPDAALAFDEVQDIVVASQKWNALRDITGRLLIVVDEDDSIVAFMQWIEGPTLEIQACLKRIMADPRHDSIRIVKDAQVTERSYPEWSMAQEVIAPERVEAALASIGQAGHMSESGDLVLDVDGELVDGDET